MRALIRTTLAQACAPLSCAGCRPGLHWGIHACGFSAKQGFFGNIGGSGGTRQPPRNRSKRAGQVRQDYFWSNLPNQRKADLDGMEAQLDAAAKQKLDSRHYGTVRAAIDDVIKQVRHTAHRTENPEGAVPTKRPRLGVLPGFARNHCFTRGRRGTRRRLPRVASAQPRCRAAHPSGPCPDRTPEPLVSRCRPLEPPGIGRIHPTEIVASAIAHLFRHALRSYRAHAGFFRLAISRKTERYGA